MDSRLVLPVDTVLEGNYRIMRVVGAGGFGITYEAEDISLGTMVAIKEYYPLDFGDRDRTMSVRPKSDRHKAPFDWGRSNFLEEARTLARFEHPSIVRVTRVFEANATAYMVMRFEVGLSFEDWLCNLGRSPTQNELDAVTAPLLDALSMMHSANFLHRDIAPDNVIIRPDGTPVLIDFGAARRAAAEISRSLTGVVKAGYSPHEQYTSDSRLQGAWSDIYALGGTLYRAVAGRPPEEATLRFDDDTMVAAVKAGAGKYRRRFLAALDACLAVRHTNRPQTVAELRPMLLPGEPRSGRAVAALAGIGRMVSHWQAVAASLVLLVGACGWVAYRPAGWAEARQAPAAETIVSMERDDAARKAIAEAEARRQAEAEAGEKRRIAARKDAQQRDEAAAAARIEEERRLAALDEARREEAKKKDDEQLRLAASPSEAQRAGFVKRVQEVLKRGQCYEGQLTGRADDAQEGLDRFVNVAKTSTSKPARIVLAKASVGDFETWLRDAEHFEAACPRQPVPAIHKAKPQPTERTASARPQRAAEPARPRYAYAAGGSGGGRAPLMLGIGH